MSVAQAAVYIARPMTSYRLLGLGEGAGTVGLVAAAFALVPLFLAIPLGRYADRRHAGSLIAFGCAAQTVAILSLAIVETTIGIASATVLLGLGHLALALGVQHVIARESSDIRHDQHFGLMTAGMSVGQLVGPLLAGALLSSREGDLIAGTSVAMVAGAAVAGVATVFALLAQRSHDERVDVPATEQRRASVRSILGTGGVPAAIFASVAVLTAADLFTAYMPVLGEERGIDPGVIGVLLAVRAGASLVSRVGIGTIVHRVGRLRVITIAAGAAAAAFAGIALTDDTVALVALSAVIGLGLGFGQPLSMTIVVQLVPHHARATALGVRLTGNRLGQVAVPVAAGAVAGSAGAAAVFWLLAALLVASAAAVQRHALAHPERPPPEPSDATAAQASID
jgi:MFS family permease